MPPEHEKHEKELKELLEEVRRIEVQTRRLVVDVLAGGYGSVFRGKGIEFDEVREYVPGDDPRHVDWNVTARTARPHVKKYVDERERTVLFLLDCSGSMSAGFGAWSLRGTAARVCACLAFSAVRNDDKVGLAAFARGVEAYVPPAKGTAHALRIVRDCLALEARSAETDLEPPLEFAARVVRRGAVVFLVSDFLGARGPACRGTPPGPGPETGGWIEALRRCARRHDLVAVRLLPPELEPLRAGLVRLRDPESGEVRVVDWGDGRVRAAYAEAAARARAEVDRALHRAGVDCMDVPVPRDPDPDALARPLLRFFHMRGRRRAKG